MQYPEPIYKDEEKGILKITLEGEFKGLEYNVSELFKNIITQINKCDYYGAILDLNRAGISSSVFLGELKATQGDLRKRDSPVYLAIVAGERLNTYKKLEEVGISELYKDIKDAIAWIKHEKKKHDSGTDEGGVGAELTK